MKCIPRFNKVYLLLFIIYTSLNICKYSYGQKSEPTLEGPLFGLSYGSQTLSDLDGISVRVLDMNLDSIEGRASRVLSESKIKWQVEGKIRDSGIRIYNDEDLKSTNNVPFLYVDIHLSFLPFSDGGYIYHIDMYLMRRMYIQSKGESYMVRSYSTNGEPGIISQDGIHRLMNYIDKETDTFIRDWSKVH